MELTLAELERIAAPIIRWLLDLDLGHHRLPGDTREVLAAYVSLLMVRTPARRDPELGFASFTGRIFTDMDLGDPEKFARRTRQRDSRSAPDLETMRQKMLRQLRDGDITLEADNATTMSTFATALSDITPSLLRLRWLVVRFPGPFRLVLGDEPVVVEPPDDAYELDGSGPATPGATVLMPLGPTALLVMAQGDPDQPLFVASDADERAAFGLPSAAIANRLAWRWSRRHVYGATRTDVEMALSLLDPANRNLRPRMCIFGLPQEWIRYLPEDIEAGYDPALPKNWMKYTMLPGDVCIAPRDAAEAA